ncbi:hypothetical protein BX666DRAFT_1229894 [Dichotomocladium elegans]|nr:hypothetical protein BX666DRAFT_1229894 [Dichotomocladium elegans]
MYKRFKKRSLEKHNCALCKRAYPKEDEMIFEQFILGLSKATEGIPVKQKELEKSIVEKEERRQNLKKLQPAWTKLQSFKQEMKELDDSIRGYMEEKENLLTRIDFVSIENIEIENDKKRIDWILKQAEEVARKHREAMSLTREIEKLERDIKDTGSARTVTDCQRELEDLADERQVKIR